MHKKKILLLLGGTYHDFDGFASVITPVFRKNEYDVEATYDPEALMCLDKNRFDIVVMYTCLGGTKQDDKTGEEAYLFPIHLSFLSVSTLCSGNIR